MKTSVRCHLNILLLGACILFAGCDRLDDGLVDWFDDIVNWVRDPFYRGTNIGYLRCLKENVSDFTEGTHPISTKWTTQFSGAKRRSDLELFTLSLLLFSTLFFCL